jgi:hypothetical protein
VRSESSVPIIGSARMPSWYSSVVKRPSRSRSSVAVHSSPACSAGGVSSAMRAKKGRFIEKTKLAVSEGEKPCSPHFISANQSLEDAVRVLADDLGKSGSHVGELLRTARRRFTRSEVTL